MSKSFEATMQGRIIALELLVIQILADRIGGIDGDPIANFDIFRSRFLASLQNTARPMDSFTDDVWEVAADSVHKALETVKERIRTQNPKVAKP